MCPDRCPGLADIMAMTLKHFMKNTRRLEKEEKTIKAQELWFAILESQVETGTLHVV